MWVIDTALVSYWDSCVLGVTMSRARQSGHASQMQIYLGFLPVFAVCPEFLAASSLSLELSEFCMWTAGYTWGWVSKAKCVAAISTEPHLLCHLLLVSVVSHPCSCASPSVYAAALGNGVGNIANLKKNQQNSPKTPPPPPPKNHTPRKRVFFWTSFKQY